MGSIALDILGMTAGEARELDYPRLYSRSQIGKRLFLTGNVRIDAGLTVVAEEVDAEWAELQKKHAEIVKKYTSPEKEKQKPRRTWYGRLIENF